MKPEYRDLFFSLYKQDLRFLLGPEEDSVWFAWEGFEGDKFHTMMEAVHSAFKTITFPLIVEPTSPEILSNTIKSTEIALRGINSPHLLIIHQMTNSATSLLQNINNLRLSLIDMALSGRKPVIGKDPRIMMMTTILSFTPENINSTLTQGDFFEILVSIIPAPSLGLSFNSILRFIFVCHVIQTLHILWRELESNSRRSRKYSFDDIPRYKFLTKQDHDSAGASFRRFQSFGGGGGGGGVAHFNISDSVIYTMLLKAITPFLRRSLLLAFVQCANDAELDIFDNGFDNDCEKNEDQNNSVAEADTLCSTLNLPSLKEILVSLNEENSWENALFTNFISFLNKKNSEVLLIKRLEYPGIISLIDLPERLDYIFSRYYYLDKFGNPHRFIEDPAICLVCAKVVDLQKQATGCNEGECTVHYQKECKSGLGIFLIPKDRTMLLLHKNGGSFYNAPYLDDQGELPDENKRTKALHLMKPRYEDFNRNVWLLHNIPNYIARNLDSVLDPGGWETL